MQCFFVSILFCFLLLSCFLNAQNTESYILSASDSYIYFTEQEEPNSPKRMYCLDSKQEYTLANIPKNIYDVWRATLSHATIDEEGDIWLIIGTQLLWYTERRDWRMFIIPSKVILSVESWKGNIWVSGDRELLCFHKDTMWWEHFKYPPDLGSGSIRKSPYNNMLWLNGVCCFDGKRWYTLPTMPVTPKFWPQSRQCFTWDMKGMPWLATIFGVYFFDPAYRCWRIASGKQFRRVYSIVAHEGTIIVAEYDDGIYRRIGREWEKMKNPTEIPHVSYAYTLYSGKHGLWLDSYFGIASFDGKAWHQHKKIYTPISQIAWTLGTLILFLLVAMAILIRGQIQPLPTAEIF